MTTVRRLTQRTVKPRFFFNQFFSSVFTQEDLTQIPHPEAVELKTQLLDVAISREEVLELLKKVRTDKSPGLDGIHPRILKECAEHIWSSNYPLPKHTAGGSHTTRLEGGQCNAYLQEGKQIAGQQLPTNQSHLDHMQTHGKAD